MHYIVKFSKVLNLNIPVFHFFFKRFFKDILEVTSFVTEITHAHTFHALRTQCEGAFYLNDQWCQIWTTLLLQYYLL